MRSPAILGASIWALSVAVLGCSSEPADSGDVRELLLAIEDDGSRLAISWMGMPRFADGRENSWIEQHLEERFNIDLDPLFVDWNAMQKRKPLMMLGGDIPDVLWVKDAQMVGVEAHHGFLLELPYEVVRKHAPDYVELMLQYDESAWLMSRSDGKNYGLPTFGADFNHIYPAPGVWRMDWLRAVGIERVPETLDEMHEAFLRFRNDDPDGNGKKDTYGLTLQPSNFGSMAPSIFGAYGLLYMDWQLRDGKIVWGGVQPETKEVLGLLRKWRQEELIEPEWAVTNHLPSMTRNKFSAGLIGHARLFAMKHNLDRDAPGTDASVFYQMNPGGEMVPARFPKGPNGLRGSAVRGGSQYVMAFGKHLASEPQKVIRVLRMFNRIAVDDHLALSARLGRRGKHWDYAADRGIYRLPPYHDQARAKRELFNTRMPELSSGWGYFAPFGARFDLSDQYLSPETAAFRAEHRRKELGLQPAINRYALPSAAEFIGDLGVLTQMQAEAVARIINLEVELDHFDVFVENWHRSGGAQLTREANELFFAQQQSTGAWEDR